MKHVANTKLEDHIILPVDIKNIFADKVFLDVINNPEVETYIYYPWMDVSLNSKGYKVDSYGKIALASAIDYDTKMHPDETYFVTCDKDLADIANLFFGEDSIILI